MSYSFTDIIINNKEVSIEAICHNKAKADNNFEQNTFSFISEWVNRKSSFLQETSGSTGKPKVIELKREQMQKSAEATIKFLKVNKSDNALLCIDPTYIAGKMMLARALLGNLKIIAVNPSDDPLCNVPFNTPIGLTALVPYQAFGLIEKENLIKSKLIKHLLLGGATLPKTLESELLKNNINAYETFGMTETVSHIALRKIAEPYFKTLPGISISADERSCLVIEAAYLGGAAIISNDIVELITQESFKWIGRFDNVINSGGIKISPEQEEPHIQDLFDQLKINRRFYLTGRDHEQLGNELVLVIEGGNLGAETEMNILKKLKKRSKQYHSPQAILYKTSFKETKTGKLIRE